MANGDRAQALKMLEDPDALFKNPSVQKIIAEGAQSSDLEVEDGQYPEEAKAEVAKPTEAPVKGAEGTGKRAEGAGKGGGGGRGKKDGNNGAASGKRGLLATML